MLAHRVHRLHPLDVIEWCVRFLLSLAQGDQVRFLAASRGRPHTVLPVICRRDAMTGTRSPALLEDLRAMVFLSLRLFCGLSTYPLSERSQQEQSGHAAGRSACTISV